MTAPGFRTAVASYYDPGAGGINGRYGAGAWPGHPIEPGTNGFAHKTMPFGTQVEFQHAGRTAISTCVDRGPFVPGRTFDFLPVLADALAMHGVSVVEYREVTGSASAGTGGSTSGSTGTSHGGIGSAVIGGLLGAPFGPAGAIAGAIGGGTGVAGDALHAVTDVPSFLSKFAVIFSGNFWLRVLMVLGGLFLLGVGIVMTGKQMTIGAAVKSFVNQGSAPDLKL